MNKCFFTGRMTKDIEMRYSQGNNLAIGKFSMAVENGYGEKKTTSFFNMTAFGKTAELLEKHTNKGAKIIVECQANQNQYTDKNGNKVNNVDFIVSNFEFCESRNSQQAQNTTKPAPAPNGDMDFMKIDTDMDSLPF